MNYIIYEDNLWENFLPLTYNRTVGDLICGSRSLKDKIHSLVPETWNYSGECRRDILSSDTAPSPLSQDSDARNLFINGRLSLGRTFPDLPELDEDWVMVDLEGRVMMASLTDGRLPGDFLSNRPLETGGIKAIEYRGDAKLLEWPWELIHRHRELLEQDLLASKREWQDKPELDLSGVYLLNEKHIHVGSGTRIKPLVVIDAEEGPVYIGNNVRIMPHVSIQGPAYIGDGALLQTGATIREGSYVGPVCKVGGEIEGSIIHSYSNKQHDGFLGHSYVGSWVNIAADCINSDLKNTYGSIRVPINGSAVDSGEIFMGALIGDHSKIGINVSIPTGAVIGFSSNVFMPDCEKFVPSFTWQTDGKMVPYNLEKSKEVAKRVQARRRVEFGEPDRQLFDWIHQEASRLEHHHRWSPDRLVDATESA